MIALAATSQRLRTGVAAASPRRLPEPAAEPTMTS